MSELHLIPCCYLNGKYCSYDSAFVDGYFLGFVTMLFIMSLIGVINDINDRYKYNEDDDEPKNDSEKVSEEEEKHEEKSEEDKKEE